MSNNPPTAALPEPVTTDTVFTKLMDHMQSMQAALDLMASRSVAQEAVLSALITTHPNPERLFEEHATQLDSFGVGRMQGPREDLVKELQHFQRLILRAVNSRCLQP